MYINALTIHDFGIYEHVELSGLGSGISVFLGENEAGKSTCLEFLRCMFTGFPQNLVGYPRAKAESFGSLGLTLASGDALNLSRQRENNQEIIRLLRNGREVPAHLLDELLAGVSRERFARVFGFSLGELEKALALEDVQDALTSASFGAGLREPASVLKGLSEDMGTIFSAKSCGQVLNLALAEYERLSTSITARCEEHAGYNRLAANVQDLRTRLQKATEREHELNEEQRLLERRLDAWQLWDEWRALGLQLEEIPADACRFPENGLLRMEELEREERNLSYTLARQEEKYRALLEQKDALQVDGLLLLELPLLLRLTENKSRYRENLSRLEPQKANLRRLEKELRQTLDRLGPEWNCERIHQTDLSLFSHNALEATAIDLRAAQSSHEAAIAAMEESNLEEEAAHAALENAQSELAQLPESAALLDESQRDDLRHTLARLEEAARQLPEKEQNRELAKNAFLRATSQLSLPETPETNHAEVLDTLLDAQQKVRELAASVEKALSDEQEAEKNESNLQDRLGDIQQRIEALKEAHQEEVPDRNSLDAQAMALRRLRTLLQTQTHDAETLDIMRAELASEAAPKSEKKTGLIVLGSLLALTGSAILLAHLILSISSLALTDTLSIPINLWSGYLVLFAGVLGIWGGSPRNSEEFKKRQQEWQRKEERLATLKKKMAQQQEELEKLAAQAKIPNLDPVTLDAVEVRINRDREYCIRSEHYHQGMALLKRERDSLASKLNQAQTEKRQKNDAVQQARLAWHECLEGLGITKIPDAASAGSFLTRVEMTRMAFVSLSQAELAQKALADEQTELLAHVQSFAAVAEGLNTENPEAPEILARAQTVLQLCREADRLAEQRAQAKAKADSCQELCQRLAKRRSDASLHLEKMASAHAAQSERWQTCLKHLGLDAKLNPQTASEALKCMQDCLALESTVENAKEVLEQTQSEVQSFEQTLAESLTRAGQAAPVAAEGQVDWLGCLDHLLALAQHMERKQQESELLDKRLKEEEKELGMCRAEHDKAQEEIDDLLAKADCANAEAFRSKASQHALYEKTNLARKELESNLAVLAGSQSLQDFLLGFEQDERAVQERRNDQITFTLQNIEQEKSQILKDLATSEGKLEQLAGDESLATSLQQRANLKSEMQEQALQWMRLALAQALLKKTREQFERERQPAILKTASEMIQRITDNRWQGVRMSLDQTRTLRLQNAQGDFLPPEVLSRGTQEQVFLALRLAYIVGHAEYAEPLPLLMDEILVNFDRGRARRTALELARLASGAYGNTHQIFYFTCHPESVELLREQDANTSLYLVENGTIRQGS
ncbi:MAG: AAA family ATPase [Desulfovibrio sp.]|nr:AAA family ATPase [Desulfovibrio sp.]